MFRVGHQAQSTAHTVHHHRLLRALLLRLPIAVPWSLARHAAWRGGHVLAHHIQRGGNPIDGQAKVVSDWLERFPGMPVVLTDTFTTDATLAMLTPEQAEQVKSFRIDSGDERVIGEKIIRFLHENGINPLARTLFFSNSLTPEKAVALQQNFRGRINVSFGIGGHSVNNMGLDYAHDLPSMNIVSKAVKVNGHGTVKLSDDEGKHMGDTENVARYQQFVAARIGERALAVA